MEKDRMDSRRIEIIPAYSFPREIGELFSEYTRMLVEGERHCL